MTCREGEGELVLWCVEHRSPMVEADQPCAAARLNASQPVPEDET